MRSDVVSSIRNLTVQSRARSNGSIGTQNYLSFLERVSNIVPNWWSEQRDIALSRFWKSGDQIAGAVYSMQAKMVTIPFHVEPLDMSLKSHIQQADKFTKLLLEGAEFGDGWNAFFTPSIEALLTQDNGRFIEIVGRGDSRGAIEGAPLTVAHLDPSRCQRTGDFEYPVLYTDSNGKKHKLHYTRVMFDSQMPSAKVDMFGVGFCAISRALHNAQHLIDIAMYEEEKLGSRPFRGIILAGGGLDPEAVGNALQQAQTTLDAQGFTRYTRMPIVGSPEIESPSLEVESLTSAPDYFNKEQSTTLSMAAIALAFGVDARELWPSQGIGATRADAMLSHIKMQGKGPGHIIEATERMFNYKFLPKHLRLVFDYQDDTQDRQRAEIRQVRSRARDRDINNKVTNERVERQKMLENGEIDTAQFTELELSNGRLEDGKSVLTLFYSKDPEVMEMLNISVSNPLSVRTNNPETVLKAIDDQKAKIFEMIADIDVGSIETNARKSVAALDELERLYTERFEEDRQREMEERDQFGDNNPTGADGDLAPSSAETKLSENDTSMNPDDKKKKGIFSRLFKRKDEETVDAVEEEETIVKEKSMLVKMIEAADSKRALYKALLNGIKEVDEPLFKRKTITTGEGREIVIEDSIDTKGNMEVIDIERDEFGEITRITRKRVKG